MYCMHNKRRVGRVSQQDNGDRVMAQAATISQDMLPLLPDNWARWRMGTAAGPLGQGLISRYEDGALKSRRRRDGAAAKKLVWQSRRPRGARSQESQHHSADPASLGSRISSILKGRG